MTWSWEHHPAWGRFWAAVVVSLLYVVGLVWLMLDAHAHADETRRDRT